MGGEIRGHGHQPRSREGERRKKKGLKAELEFIGNANTQCAEIVECFIT